MSLPNTPKTDWDINDGVQFTDLNEIGENLVHLDEDTEHLEDVKYEENDSPTFVDGKKLLTSANYLHGTVDDNDVFDKLAPFIPDNGNVMQIIGGIVVGGAVNNGPVSRAERLNSTTVRLYYIRIETGAASQFDFVNGGATSRKVSLSW